MPERDSSAEPTVRFDAVTPDGERLHFEDFIYTGEVVGDDRCGYFRVGEDRGDGVALLTPLSREEYLAHWQACNPHLAHIAALDAPRCGHLEASHVDSHSPPMRCNLSSGHPGGCQFGAASDAKEERADG